MPQGRRLPTRLLDVNIEQGDAFICLQESHMVDPNAKYITLSHCWGSSLPVRLLQASYQQFCDHIPVSTLPRTFQDAIQFVRTLQIRYIWIDALCIVQDSKDDWLRESLQMASIYSYSWLNIAATSSADGHGGLFKKRNRLLPARCQVNASWTGHMPGLYICFDQSAWARRVEDGHLNTRGWVLQERLLAPRNVHFAYDQIWWECRETRACEAFPNGIPDYVLHLDIEKAKLLLDLDPKDPLGSNEQWLGIVKIYTQTHLTKDSDRLIALAGIASTVQNTLRWPVNDYHAGLWRYDLPVDLLWRMAASGTRVREYVAPSWSWASVNGEVYFNSSENRAIIRKTA
jgi:Heterokaryon incompatibility protein (HET)